MGSITVVNLTNSSLRSAITNTGVIYSSINGLYQNAYYHHNAASGTGYDVWEKWYVPVITDDFEKTGIGSYISGTLLAVAGIVATGSSGVALLPSWTTFKADIDTINQNRFAAATTAATAADATAKLTRAAKALQDAVDALKSDAANDDIIAANDVAYIAFNNARAAAVAANNAATAAAAIVTTAAIVTDVQAAVNKFVNMAGKMALTGVALGGLVGITERKSVHDLHLLRGPSE